MEGDYQNYEDEEGDEKQENNSNAEEDERNTEDGSGYLPPQPNSQKKACVIRKG